MSDGPVIDSGFPDPFTVVHQANLEYNKTAFLPASQLINTTTTLSANRMKSALLFTGAGTAARLVTLPSTESIFKTFTPKVGAGVSVPIVNRSAAHLIFTGGDAFTTKPLGANGGLFLPRQDSDLLLVCTSVISSSNNTGSFTLY